MTWRQRQGLKPKEMSWLAKVQAEQGKQFECLLNMPKLTWHEAFYMEVFYDLSSSRLTTGWGIAPIMFSEINAYLQVRQITLLDLRMDLIHYVKAMDRAFIEMVANQQKKPGVK